MIHDEGGVLLLPAVLVGFDPQPEPPGHMLEFDLADPTRPLFHVSSSGPDFSIQFGLLLPAVHTQFEGFDMGAPNVDGFYSFTGMLGDRELLIEFLLETSSPLDRASWVGFNPQPEPPGFPGAVQFDFSMNGQRGSLYEATLAIRVHNGDELMRFDVPGPASAAFLAPIMLWAARRRRSEAGTAPSLASSAPRTAQPTVPS
jgi:hypothetical protein